jgi:hypothetical protein
MYIHVGNTLLFRYIFLCSRELTGTAGEINRDGWCLNCLHWPRSLQCLLRVSKPVQSPNLQTFSGG